MPVTPRRKNPKSRSALPRFDLETYLDSPLPKRQKVKFARNSRVFTQGGTASHLFYILRGGVKLTVISSTGKEAVLAMIGPGHFFGESCLIGQSVRMGSATAIVPTIVYQIPKTEMTRMLHEKQDFSDNFMRHVLARTIRVEEDLIDQLFNSSEKRLARTLLRLAHFGRDDHPAGVLPPLSQETLAEMIGSTRSRVNFFMNKFRKLGFIEYKGRVKVNSSLLNVVLHD